MHPIKGFWFLITTKLIGAMRVGNPKKNRTVDRNK
jgi:hypothetical protein